MSLLRLALGAAAAAAAAALSLRGGALTVELDDAFPRPLSYSHAVTGDSFRGALAGVPGFHLSMSVNAGQATCGEASISTTYLPLPMPPGEEGAEFSVVAACLLNWPDAASTSPPRGRGGAAPPAIVYIELNGTVLVQPDAAVAPAGAADVFAWTLTSAVVAAGSSPGLAAVASIDVAGLELVSFQPVPAANTSACFHVPDEDGSSPHCGSSS